MGTIFLYHSGRAFMIDDSWHIMNPEPDLLFTLVIVFVSGWIMPLFFVISGMATCFSLAKRSPAQFANDRFKRLMIPFLLPGLLVILPVHVYYDKVFHGSFSGSFASFYLGQYFTTEYFPFDTDLSPTYFADSFRCVPLVHFLAVRILPGDSPLLQVAHQRRKSQQDLEASDRLQ